MAETGRKCCNCQSWDVDVEPYEDAVAPGLHYGFCSAPVEHSGATGEGMLVQDASVYFARLYTRDTHCCAEFKGRVYN